MGTQLFKPVWRLGLFLCLFLTIFSFQNCGPGFELQDASLDVDTEHLVTLKTLDVNGQILRSKAGYIDEKTGDIVVGGDMIIGHEDELDDEGEIEFNPLTSRSGKPGEVQSSLALSGRKWGSVVPYFFAKGSNFSSNQKHSILKAIDSFNTSMSKNKINLSFRPFQSGDRKSVGFVSGGTACYVRNRGLPDDGTSGIYLGNRCFDRYVIIHEMMHILGFIHEHQRADRKGRIAINKKNIINGKQGHFDELKGAHRKTPYDIYSIMHYSGNLFSRNGKPTIERIVNGQRQLLKRVNKHLSGRDIAGLRAVYGSTNWDPNRPPPEVVPFLPPPNEGPNKSSDSDNEISLSRLQTGKKYRHDGTNVYFNGSRVCDLDNNSRSTRGLIDTDKNNYPALKDKLRVEFNKMYQKSKSARQCGF